MLLFRSLVACFSVGFAIALYFYFFCSDMDWSARGKVFTSVTYLSIPFCLGFLDKEIRKDGIPILETGENPEAPQPREMIDLEVISSRLL